MIQSAHLLISVLITLTLFSTPVSSQNRAIASNVCYKFQGEINNERTPVSMRHQYEDVFTCSTDQNNKQTNFKRAQKLIADNKEWKVLLGRDWRIVTLNTIELRSINLEIQPKLFVKLMIPVQENQQFYFLVVDNRR